mgnify:CR=1 FL=1
MIAASIDNALGLVAADLLTAYLVVVLVLPERF